MQLAIYVMGGAKSNVLKQTLKTFGMCLELTGGVHLRIREVPTSGVPRFHCGWRLISTRGLSNYFYRSKYMSLGYAEVAEMAVGLYYPQKKSIGR